MMKKKISIFGCETSKGFKEADMNVKEITEKYLKENGFEGLFDEGGECGCLLDDLMPCGEGGSACEPGYKLPGNEECDFLIGPKPDTSGG